MRRFGILLGISSLPGKYGIGSFGRSAYQFADFLKRIGAKVWQILPICPTSYGDSPYQSFSTFAGNPYYIDLETLAGEGLMRREDLPAEYTQNHGYVDYGTLYKERFATLKKAFSYSYAKVKDKVEAFKSENEWLSDYALFMAIKDRLGGTSWQEWEDTSLRAREPSALALAFSEHREAVDFHCYLQYLFYEQYHRLKSYVNALGIEVLGDMPLYVALDSADVWANPEIFDLGPDLRPNKVAGVPPDYFSEDGQLWGNPLYNWAYLKETGYAWWIQRLSAAAAQYDILRLDHFIGFARYYAIPYGEKTARVGEWMTGAGKELFDAAYAKIEHLNLVAEDLGILTEDVIRLREAFGLPGMGVLQFFFNPNGASTLPSEVSPHSVIYTGTHDNETLMGFLDGLDDGTKRFIADKLQLRSAKNLAPQMIRACLAAPAELAILPMQDLLYLYGSARMNTPGTVGDNWKWRVEENAFTSALERRIKRYVKEANR